MFKRLLFGGHGGGSPLADFGLLLGRASVGLLLAFGHGLGKVRNPAGMAGPLEKMGVPMPTVSSWLATIAEFGGGLLLALGLLTRPAAFLIACTMTVAVLTAHRNDPTFMMKAGTVRTQRVENGQTVVVESKGGSKEAALLYLAPALLFLFAGSGRFGLDAVLRRERRLPPGFPVEDEPAPPPRHV
jgi:putative oxidoreductase